MSELKKIFDELYQEHPIDEMVGFDETDIHIKLQENQLKVIHYKELYYVELDLYEDLERKMKALMGKRYKHYKFDVEEQWEKKEIVDYCLESDKSIIQMKKIMQKQKARVKIDSLKMDALRKCLVNWLKWLVILPKHSRSRLRHNKNRMNA